MMPDSLKRNIVFCLVIWAITISLMVAYHIFFPDDFFVQGVIFGMAGFSSIFLGVLEQ